MERPAKDRAAWLAPFRELPKLEVRDREVPLEGELSLEVPPMTILAKNRAKSSLKAFTLVGDRALPGGNPSTTRVFTQAEGGCLPSVSHDTKGGPPSFYLVILPAWEKEKRKTRPI